MKHNRWVWVIVAVSTLACCGRKTQSGEAAPDSAKVEQTVSLEQLFLPDTSYASVKEVQYVVEQTDSIDYPLLYLEDRYQRANGILVFRGNLLRNAQYGGKVKGTPSKVDIAWEFTTAIDTTHTKFGVWGGGSGWTGQPLYAKWTDKQMADFQRVLDMSMQEGGLINTSLEIGAKVVVAKGPLRGVEGFVTQSDGKYYVVVSLLGSIFAKVQVPRAYLELI